MVTEVRAIFGRAYRNILGRSTPAGVIAATGIGCRLELSGNKLRIKKGGAFGLVVSLLGHSGAFLDRTIRVSDISAIEVDSPIMLFKYMRFAYPGAPRPTGHAVQDMLAENAIIMSLIDNRDLYALKTRIEQAMDAAPRA